MNVDRIKLFLQNKDSKFVIWGTGGIFEKVISLFDIDIEKQVICFVESKPEKDTFLNKRVYNSIDFFEFLKSKKENVNIVVCSSSTHEIYKHFLINDIDKKNVFMAFNLFALDFYESNSQLISMKESFVKFINQERDTVQLTVPNFNEKVLIVVKRWESSAIPYFQITLGILLKLRGVSVKFLFDDISRYEDIKRHIQISEKQNEVLEDVLKLVQNIYNIPFEKLSNQEETLLTEEEEKKIKYTIYLNKVWDTKKIFFEKSDTYYNEIEDHFLKNAEIIKTYLIREKPQKVFAFSAIHFEYGIIKDICNLLDIDVYSSENIRSGYGFSKNGPTVWQKDISEYKNIQIENKTYSKLIEMANIDYEKNMVNLQPIINNDNYVVIPTNIFWDSASFSENDLFNTFEEWLVCTISYILYDCGLSVIVRQHPHEKLFGSGLDIKNKLNEIFGESDKFIFVSCYENLNTYALLKYAKMVLPNTSTVGIEAAILGKKVILKNDVYYSDTEFVHKANSKQEYFDIIRKTANGEHELQKNEIEKAKIYYSLTMLNSVEKNFGHEYEEISNWISESLDDLLMKKEVQWLLDCIIDNRSLLSSKLENGIF